MAKAKYSRNSRGVFTTRVWNGTYDSTGKKVRINLTSHKSSADLERQVNELKNRVKNDGAALLPTDISFYDYAKHWLDVRKSVKEKNTLAMYTNIVEKHLVFLSDVRLTDFCNSYFQQAISRNKEKPRTCQQIYITVNQVIRMAVSDHYITAANRELICADISLPKYQRSEKRPLTSKEKDSLKKCYDESIFTDRERAFLTIIYNCGLRKGEALALTRFDFTFSKEKNSVSISKSLIFDQNTPEIKSYPKTDNGIRIVPLPSQCLDFMKGYISTLDGSNLFYCTTNIYMTKSSYDKMWLSIISKLNTAAGGTKAFPAITGLTAHVFRHNYCSNLCYKVPDISIKKIAQLMGDTEKVVLDVYNHIIEEKENVNEVVDSALAI